MAEIQWDSGHAGSFHVARGCSLSFPASAFGHKVSYARRSAIGSVFHFEPGSAHGESVISRQRARALALQTGFSDAGLIPFPYKTEERDARRFSEWVSAERAGSMSYLERVDENGHLLRARRGIAMQSCRSAIVWFASYQTP